MKQWEKIAKLLNKPALGGTQRSDGTWVRMHEPVRVWGDTRRIACITFNDKTNKATLWLEPNSAEPQSRLGALLGPVGYEPDFCLVCL